MKTTNFPYSVELRIDAETLAVLDRMVGKIAPSRSAVIRELIRKEADRRKAKVIDAQTAP